MSDTPTTGSQALRPKARLIRAIGDQLISNEVVALLELVKNSYDADATCVLLQFHDDSVFKGRRVQVIDNGVGMSLDTIRSAWMEPATDWKAERPKSEVFGRRVLGEKGLGRFAAARVADHFYATTRRKASLRESRVLLDWTAFDHKDRYLDEVLVLWDETTPRDITPLGVAEQQLVRAGLLQPSQYEHGTVLSLEMLRKEWRDEDYRTLQRALSRLVSPFEESIPSNFAIVLEPPPGFSAFAGRVAAPSVFQHPHYALEGSIDAVGVATMKISMRGAEQLVSKAFVLRNERVARCGAFEFKLRVWDRDEMSLRSLAQSLNVGVGDIRRDIDAIEGVNIYRDGFRILPYGEPGNDWLGLDQRRVQNPTLRLSNNQVSGYVFITADGNDLLTDQSNREGLFDNQAFRDLRELLVSAIAELEGARYESRPRQEARKDNKKADSGIFGGFSLDPLRRVAAGRRKDDQLEKAIDETQQQLDERVALVKTVLSRYQRLATLGSLVDLVLHEGRQPLTGIRYDVDEIRGILTQTPTDGLPLVVNRVLQLLAEVDKNSDLLSAIFKKVDPFSGRQRGRPKKVIVEDEVAAGVALVSKELAEAGAHITLPTTKTEAHFDAADVQIIIKNLVQNSAYWLRHVPRDKRRLVIEVNRPTPGTVEIMVSDSGPGVPAGDRDEIWRPYFTRKPDGVGLGLAIVGEIVQDHYAGELGLTDGPLPGATFTVTLKKRTG